METFLIVFKLLAPESALALNFNQKQFVNVSIFCLLENLKNFKPTKAKFPF